MKMIYFLFFGVFLNIFQVGQRGLEWRFQGGLGGWAKKNFRLAIARHDPPWNTVLIFTLLQLIKFWLSRAPGRRLRRGENFWLRLNTTSAQCLRLSERLFFISVVIVTIILSLRYDQERGHTYAIDQDVRLLITMGMNKGVRLPPAKSVGPGRRSWFWVLWLHSHYYSSRADD